MAQVKYAYDVKPFKGCSVSGDKFYTCKNDDGDTLIYLIDMSGHGHNANKYGEDLLKIIEDKLDKDRSVVEQIKELHALTNNNQLCVLAIAQICASGYVQFASVGTVVGRYIHNSSGVSQYIAQDDGVLGYILPRARLHELDIKDGLFLIYSDGVKSHFNLKEYESILTDSLEEVASNIVADFGKDDDDVSCVAIRVVS